MIINVYSDILISKNVNEYLSLWMNLKSCWKTSVSFGLGPFSRFLRVSRLLVDWAGLLKSKHALATGSFLLPPQRSLFANRLEGKRALYQRAGDCESADVQLWWSHKEPRAKSSEHALDALALINLFGSYHRFGKNDPQQIKKVKENVILVCLWHLIIWWFVAGECLTLCKLFVLLPASFTY